MAQGTKIEWCDDTANLWWGCQHVHPGCDHCYAEAWAKSKGKHWENRYEIPGVWKALAKLQRLAKSEGRTRTVFVGSMMDIFERRQPLLTFQGGMTPITTGELRMQFFREALPACPDLTFLLLTKRPSNITKLCPIEWLDGEWPGNVWTGTSVVDQATAETLLPQLLAAPGPHFASFEPLLGPVDLSVDARWRWAGSGLRWGIVGGESGPHARPMHPDWARGLRDQLVEAGIPFLFKQWGETAPADQLPEEAWDAFQHYATSGMRDDHPCRVGKKAAGRMLDGVEWNQFPAFRKEALAC